MNIKKEEISCPTCGKKNTWQATNPDRPFCSSRCKLVDLGDWADEKHRIPVEPDTSENNLPEDDNENDKQS